MIKEIIKKNLNVVLLLCNQLLMIVYNDNYFQLNFMQFQFFFLTLNSIDWNQMGIFKLKWESGKHLNLKKLLIRASF